eukprot:2685485-Pyramimonas_sp.AAC.1
MLRGNDVRATGEATDVLPEPLNAQRCADWAVEREPAAVEEVMLSWATGILRLWTWRGTSSSSTRGDSKGRWARKHSQSRLRPAIS